MYKHMVIFNLKSDLNSEETDQFLEAAVRELRTIPEVENFQILRQVSPKNDFALCFSMDFVNEEEFYAYQEHPTHRKFVEERWNKEVAEFLEVDLLQNFRRSI
ncbi:MAG: Dabb family protein [Defluviitaleaceae bacterium]|nr:Dabb family protein [Defluviitaleaceae bacterium]